MDGQQRPLDDEGERRPASLPTKGDAHGMVPLAWGSVWGAMNRLEMEGAVRLRHVKKTIICQEAIQFGCGPVGNERTG